MAALFEAHARLVLGICRGMLRDADEAEDAAQQVFLSAFGSLLAGRAPRDEEAWIATIARNECRTRIRSRMREPLAELDGETLEARDDALAATVRRADVRALRRALADLPAQQRQAFMLREFSGLSYEELAGTLSVSLGSVESLLFRARQTLRARLEPAFAGLNGLAAFPLALLRLLGSGGGESAGGIAKVASLPLAAKLAAAGVGAAIVAGGTVGLETQARHHSTFRPAAPPAAPRHARPAKAPAGARAPLHPAAAPAPAASGASVEVAARRPGGGSGQSAPPGRSRGRAPAPARPSSRERSGGNDGSSRDGGTTIPVVTPVKDGGSGSGSSDGGGSGDGSATSGSSGSGDGSGSGSQTSSGSGSETSSGSGSGDTTESGGTVTTTSDEHSGSGSGSGDSTDGNDGSGSGGEGSHASGSGDPTLGN